MDESINIIEKTNVIYDDVIDPVTESSMNVQVELSDGKMLSFTAESQFFTPRRIETNSPSILNLPEEFVVGRTPNNVPVVKLPIGAKDITTPQYYANSIVRDVYQTNDINNFFTELTNDLLIPAEPKILQTLRDQRDSALLAASALDDLIASTEAGDVDAVLQANQDIDDGLEAATAFEPSIDELMTPEEENEMAALDMVGLLDAETESSIADDEISPLPLVDPENIATGLPYLQSKLDGIDKINKGIEYLNEGLGVVENAVRDADTGQGQCKEIPVAKGKRRFGVGKRKSIKVSRDKVVERRNFARAELEKQQSSTTPIPDYYKSPQYLLQRNNVQALAAARNQLTSKLITGEVGASARLINATKNVVLLAFTKKFKPNQRFAVSKKFVPMTREQIIEVLQIIVDELQKTLDKPC